MSRPYLPGTATTILLALSALLAVSSCAKALPEKTLIGAVTEVRLERGADRSGALRVHARGQVKSTGWSAPELRRVPRNGSPPGTITFKFLMKAPTGMVGMAITTVRTSIVLDPIPAGTHTIRVIGGFGGAAATLAPPSTAPRP